MVTNILKLKLSSAWIANDVKTIDIFVEVTRRIGGAMMTRYVVNGCIEKIGNGESIIEAVAGDDEAQFWGVYFINERGFHDNIADFVNKEDALAFAEIKNSTFRLSDPATLKIEFVRKCGELLCIAKPHLLKCELKLGKEITDHVFRRGIHPLDEYVVVTCKNGHTYNIPIEANSLSAIAYDIFKEMMHK